MIVFSSPVNPPSVHERIHKRITRLNKYSDYGVRLILICLKWMKGGGGGGGWFSPVSWVTLLSTLSSVGVAVCKYRKDSISAQVKKTEIYKRQKIRKTVRDGEIQSIFRTQHFT